MLKQTATLFFILLTSVLWGQTTSSELEGILKTNQQKLSLSDQDLSELLITDNYTSLGINHTYFKQAVGGIEVYNSYGAVHGRSGSMFLDGNSLIQQLSSYKVDRREVSSVEDLLSRIASQKAYSFTNDLTTIESEPLTNEKAVYEAKSISQSPIQSRLVYYVVGKDRLQLGRILTIDDIDSPDYFEFLVDATTGEIIKEYNYTVYCDLEGEDHSDHDHAAHSNHNHTSTTKKITEKAVINNNAAVAPNQYRVYAQPVESPHQGVQSDVTAPWLLNPAASPNGWHNFNGSDFTFTRGNNVDSYLDNDNTNGPTGGDAARASGGATLEFLYDIDVAGDPVNFQEGALVNLFYWNNIIHDVWYNYGFDEASGNFQEENYGATGNAGDYVRAEAQDGSGTCNANMSTPSDGGNPRMQMYLCNGRDGDIDNGVVVHEYVHGISNRLTGGPGAAGCLGNQEQMGEGWSDYYGIMMTIQPGDTAETLRPIGNWLVGQGANGGGIRSHPYTTDTNENPFTYDDIKTESVPHGVGSVWCTMLWDMTWALIDEYGFDPDLYAGTGGNNIAMFLVTEGMKMQPCSPGFVDGRDAILAADMALYGGANQCLIWEAFAARGLGFSASQGGSGSRADGTEAFDMPGTCVIGMQKTADKTEAAPGDEITYTITAINNTAIVKTGLVISDPLPANTLFVSASDGGSETGGIVNFPAFDLALNGTKTVTFTVQIDPATSADIPDFIDDMEGGTALWTTNNTGGSQFGISTTEANSGTNSWFAADVTTTSTANLVTASTLYLSDTSTLTFSHFYVTEATYDGGNVEVSQDNGATWVDVEPHFTANGYNSTVTGKPGFSGNSGGFITSVVDLSAFSGPSLIRFKMSCDVSVGGVGWYIDDVIIDNQNLSIPNTAQIQDGPDTYLGILQTPTAVLGDPTLLTIATATEGVLCNGRPDGKAWVTAASGTGNYTYSWSTGATTDTIFNLLAGAYQVTVNDGITTRIATAVVAEPALLILNMSSTDAPAGTGGTATATPQGGTAPFIYAWDNGGTTQTITSLVPGTYTVTVTDANDCTEVDDVDVIDPTNCTDNSLVVQFMMDQWPEDISFFVRDGTGAVVFEKVYDNSTPDGALVNEYICLIDDCYEIEIVDDFGDGLCQNGNIVGFYKIIDAASSRVLFEGCDIGTGVTHDLCYPLLSVTHTQMDPSCTGLVDGSIDLTLNGGNPNPTIAYSNGTTTEDASGLAAGEYIVTVNDGVTEVVDTIIIYDSRGSVYVNAGNNAGSLYYAATNSCITDTIKFEDILMNDVVVIDQEVPLQNGHIVNGLGMDMITVSGANAHRIFTVPPAATVKIFNMTLQDGNAATDGGAIFNEGKLTLEGVEFVNNTEGTTPKSLTNKGFLIIEGEVVIQN